MTRVCLFDRRLGASIDEWPESAILPRVTRDGTVYRRHLLSVLFSPKASHEAIVYTDCALTPAEEFTVFEALFPNRGGAFQIDLAD